MAVSPACSPLTSTSSCGRSAVSWVETRRIFLICAASPSSAAAIRSRCVYLGLAASSFDFLDFSHASSAVAAAFSKNVIFSMWSVSELAAGVALDRARRRRIHENHPRFFAGAASASASGAGGASSGGASSNFSRC
jgi:anti-sigma factor RsiW